MPQLTRWCTWLTLSLLGVGAFLHDEAFAQRSTAISDGSECSRCRISLTHAVTLRGPDNIGLSAGTVIVRSGAWYVAAPTYAPGTFLVYDSTGAVISRFGKPGGGPGEIQGRSYRVTVGPGDTVHVVDQAKWSIFRPHDFRFVRSFPVHDPVTHVAVTHLSEPVISYQYFQAGGISPRIAVLNPVTGAVSRSLLSGGISDGAANVHVLSANGEGIWISPILREQVTLFQPAGTLRTWSRSTGWFPASSSRTLGEPFYERPSPRIIGIKAEADLIWVFGTVADRNWKARPRPQTAEMPRITDADPDGVFDGIIEVIDRRTGHVLTRVSQDWVARPLPGEGNLVRRAVTRSDGEIEITILRLKLVRS